MNVRKSILKSEQITNYILSQIKSGALTYNSIVPSITQVKKELGVANETVVKAYKKLKEKGILYSVHGKGFFVAKVDFQVQHRIFVLFDTFAAYKETLYNAMLHQFGEYASLDIYFHHYNYKLFETLIKESAGKYTEYIILSHLDQDITPALTHLPSNKVFILDSFVANYPMRGIYQDFENDAYNALFSTGRSVLKYRKFYFIHKKREYTKVLAQIKSGFIRFCNEANIENIILEGDFTPEPQKGEAFVIIDDDLLVELVICAEKKGLRLGKDIGIISYNDTPLKKISAGGISVITTDFAAMGHKIADIILNNSNECIKNKTSFIDRGSF